MEWLVAVLLFGSHPRRYLPFTNPAVAVRSYQRLVPHERCRAVSRYVIRCNGSPNIEELRKLGPHFAEFRVWSLGRWRYSTVTWRLPGW